MLLFLDDYIEIIKNSKKKKRNRKKSTNNEKNKSKNKDALESMRIA